MKASIAFSIFEILTLTSFSDVSVPVISRVSVVVPRRITARYVLSSAVISSDAFVAFPRRRGSSLSKTDMMKTTLKEGLSALSVRTRDMLTEKNAGASGR